MKKFVEFPAGVVVIHFGFMKPVLSKTQMKELYDSALIDPKKDWTMDNVRPNSYSKTYKVTQTVEKIEYILRKKQVNFTVPLETMKEIIEESKPIEWELPLSEYYN